jgi:hypothetical protein
MKGRLAPFPSLYEQGRSAISGLIGFHLVGEVAEFCIDDISSGPSDRIVWQLPEHPFGVLASLYVFEAGGVAVKCSQFLKNVKDRLAYQALADREVEFEKDVFLAVIAFSGIADVLHIPFGALRPGPLRRLTAIPGSALILGLRCPLNCIRLRLHPRGFRLR